MNEWKRYRKSGVAEMRPYLPGENLAGISITVGLLPQTGGMIARDPKNHLDLWYVSPTFFERNYEEEK